MGEFRWVASPDEVCRRETISAGAQAGFFFRYAVEQPSPDLCDGSNDNKRNDGLPKENQLYLHLDLECGVFVKSPEFFVSSSPLGCDLAEIKTDNRTNVLSYAIVIPHPSDPTKDDAVILDIEDRSGLGIPPCRVVLRRTSCKINTALLERGQAPWRLSPQTKAALLWHAWRRCSELVALKQIRTGRSGSEVLVFRPRLRAPDNDQTSLEGGIFPCVLQNAWGSCILVKTGEARKVRKEWDCCRTFLTDRMHPFLARSEAFLPVRPLGEPNRAAAPPERATLISSFLGGDLIRPEPLEHMIGGTSDIDRCKRMLDRVFSILAPWHAVSQDHALKEWRQIYHGTKQDWVLFGKFDLTRKGAAGSRKGRDEYVAGLLWDSSFITKDHLYDHLLGKNRDGLLHSLSEIPARYSLTHGDLNPRNILCEGDHAWLIDFEHTGVAPALADYAWLEANLRLWCLPLLPGRENVADAAVAFETHLVDYFLGSESSLEPVAGLADRLGAEPERLLKIAHCIAHIRARATAACVDESPERRDYLAVLYLSVLSLLQYAGEAAAPPENYRVLVSLAWVLEELLCRMIGKQPFDRKRFFLDPKHLITREWLKAPGAPRRVQYLMDRPDGRRALEPLAATKGVLQSHNHHLDVFDHTLLVIAYVETILENPLAALLDVARVDCQVAECLRRQGIVLPPIPASSATPLEPGVSALEPCHPAIEAYLQNQLDGVSRLLLKWVALLHDVGKPGTRCQNRQTKESKVQFLNHEVYGLQLLKGTLETLFPEHDQRLRVRTMIRWHHIHHHIVGLYSIYPQRFQALVKGLTDLTVPAEECNFLAKFLCPPSVDYLSDFPLLILFGFADRLACRGPKNETLTIVAEIDLAVLAFCAQYPLIKKRQDDARKKHAQSSRMYQELSERFRDTNSIKQNDWKQIWETVMRELRPWHDEEQRLQGRTESPLPDLRAKAGEILKKNFPNLRDC